MRVLTFRLPDDEANVLVQRAAKAGVSLSAYIRDAIGFTDDTRAADTRLADLEAQYAAHEDRLARLERLAGDAY